MDNNSIKDNVCKFRKQRKMTQEEMADLLGISITAYRELEKGSTSMMNQHILKMARITNTPTEEIVLGYMPAQIDNPGKLRDLQAEYDEKIQERDRRIAELEKMVSYLEETIATKNEIITMLKKSFGEDE